MRNNLVGKKFGWLTVLKDSGKRRFGHIIWICICECGNIHEAVGNDLARGRMKSCGCLRKERLRKRMWKHGEGKTRLYRIWAGMKARCYQKNNDSYKHYGTRGIKVCPSWRNNFLTFKSWAISHGYQKHLTIDRINHKGNYSPNNCQWLTASENSKKAERDRKLLNKKNIIRRAGVVYI